MREEDGKGTYTTQPDTTQCEAREEKEAAAAYVSALERLIVSKKIIIVWPKNCAQGMMDY